MAARNTNVKKGNLRSDKKKMPMNKRLGQSQVPSSTGIIQGDARLKIIQKNRTKLTDARDKLAQMAKKKDAREKLTKLRQARSTGPNPLNVSFFRPVGPSITMKKDRNGKISLSTNKAARSVAPPVSLGYAVQRQLGLIGVIQPPGMSSRQVQRKAAPPQKPFNRGPGKRSGLPAPSGPMRSDGYPSDMSMQEDYMPAAPPPVIRRTIHNDIVSELPPLPAFSYNPVEPPMHNWALPPSHPNPLLDVRRKKMMKVVARNEYAEYETTEPRSRPNPRISYIDLDAIDDSQSLRLTKPPLTPSIRARLDTPSAAPQSHGIFSKTRPKAIISPGHRIVVSNLHTAVTQEDITELFADIGDLMVARLVRPGTAEVIYKNLPDAEKAVEVYHNRQLDGQPMKCLLVNKRPANNPTAPAVVKPMNSTLRITSTGGIKKPIAATKANKLVPDLSTIHKVLFNRT